MTPQGRYRPVQDPRSPQVKTILAFSTAAALVTLSSSSHAASNGCDPNYDPCVPIASDVDCASGSGSGASARYWNRYLSVKLDPEISRLLEYLPVGI